MENQPDPTSPNEQEESTQQGTSMGGKKFDESNIDLSKYIYAMNCQDMNEKIAILLRAMRRSELTDREIELELKRSIEYMKYGPLSYQSISVKLSEVETQQIDWLWQRRIPLGKITILDGDPGIGKSLLAITIAACVSTGRPMPDSTPGAEWQTSHE